MHIGWIGLGKMGVPMAQHLLDTEHTLTVFNRTREKEKPLIDEGALSASSPKEITDKTDIIFVMISDDEAIEHVFSGDKGILAGLDEDKIIVNTSTVSPDISQEMSKKCSAKRAHYIDAPVSGSVPQAENKTLVSIVGGDEQIIDRTATLLKTYSKEIVRIGAVGSGNAMKLAVNMLLGIITGGLAEVLQFVQQMNLAPKKFMNIINNSALHSPFVEMKGQAVLDDDYQAAFTLEHLAKDLRLAKKTGFSGPSGLQVHDNFQSAEENFGQEDVIAIIKYLQKK